MSDVKERLKKILELARRGEGGEQANARRMLDKLLVKHGLTEADLSDEVRTRRAFQPKDARDSQILMQVAASLLGHQTKMFRVGDRRGTRVLHLTNMEFAEVQFLWDVYRRQWRKEQERLFNAFLVKHDLFPKDTPADDEPRSTISPEEAQRILRMARGLEDVAARKALENKA